NVNDENKCLRDGSIPSNLRAVDFVISDRSQEIQRLAARLSTGRRLMKSRSTSSETSDRGNGTVSPSEVAADAVNLDEARAAKLGQKFDLAAALLQPSPDSLTATGEQFSVRVVSKLSDEFRLGRRTLNEV